MPLTLQYLQGLEHYITYLLLDTSYLLLVDGVPPDQEVYSESTIYTRLSDPQTLIQTDFQN